MKVIEIFLRLYLIPTLITLHHLTSAEGSHLRIEAEDHMHCDEFTREVPCSRAGCKWELGTCRSNCGVFLRRGPCNMIKACLWWNDKCIPMPKCELFLREKPCNQAGACMWTNRRNGRCIYRP